MLRQVARNADGGRIVIWGDSLSGLTYRPWRWWSPADHMRWMRRTP